MQNMKTVLILISMIFPKNSARAKVITEDEAGVKELMQYDNCVFLFMSSKDIYKFEEMLIEAKKPI